MSRTEPDFAVACVHQDGLTTMVLRGRLTARHNALFETALSDALRHLPGRLVIDATALATVDPVTVEVLQRWCDSPAGHLVPIVVRAPTPSVISLLAASGLADLAVDRAEDAAEETDRPWRPHVTGISTGGATP
jgi:anti-anti-sigma regulatory factor